MSLETKNSEFKAAIKAIFDELKTYDGSSGKGQAESIEKLANDLQNAIYNYVIEASIYVTAAQMTASGATAGGYPVVLVNDLQVTIE